MDDHPSPTISVVLCTYNGAAYLAKQLDSLAAQRYGDFEVVVSDDGSVDETFSILYRYRDCLPRFRILEGETGLGASRNFMRAFKACRGEFIAPCDQDDEWHEEKLAKLVDKIGSSDLVYCDSLLTDSNGNSLGRSVSDRYRMYFGTDPRVFTLMNCVSGHASLFRRSLLDRMSSVPVGAYYDWWLAVNAAAMGGVAYIDRPLVRFRQHDRSASAFTGRRPEGGRDPVAECWRNQLSNLNALATVPAAGATRAYFRRIAELWSRHPRYRLDWPLFLFAWRHRKILFALRRTPPWLRWRHAFKMLVVPGELRRAEAEDVA